jgi:hypothetical protein
MAYESRSKSSGVLAVGTATSVSTTPCLVTAITLRVGTTATSLSLLDNAVSQWIISNVAVTAAGDTTISMTFPHGLIFSTNLTMTLAGTNATAYIAYQPL